MPLITNAVKGMQDILPGESEKWRYIEQSLTDNAALFGYQEFRTPVLEHTELFSRSVGGDTDVVQKEMYTFDDKGGRSVTLRPEGTAGVVRAFLEHGLQNQPLPLKTCYLTSCYRYERPQAGRLREFHQFGVELFGPASYTADAEVIALADFLLRKLGMENLTLEINSIGCPHCRPVFHQTLRDYFEGQIEGLCNTCADRLTRNPMRVLDCKCPSCQTIAKKAPSTLDSLCEPCRDHFNGVKDCMTAAGIAFTVNPFIVRGLDYYTRTVFEFISADLGAQATVCGGGRYDGLTEELGGQPLPALGFAMGLERILMIMEKQGVAFPPQKRCDVYIATLGEGAMREAARLCGELRTEGFSAESELMGRSLKAQMKYANKIGARFTLVMGDNELAQGRAPFKNMSDGTEQTVDFRNSLLETVYEVCLNNAWDDLENAAEGMKHER